MSITFTTHTVPEHKYCDKIKEVLSSKKTPALPDEATTPREEIPLMAVVLLRGDETVKEALGKSMPPLMVFPPHETDKAIEIIMLLARHFSKVNKYSKPLSFAVLETDMAEVDAALQVFRDYRRTIGIRGGPIRQGVDKLNPVLAGIMHKGSYAFGRFHPDIGVRHPHNMLVIETAAPVNSEACHVGAEYHPPGRDEAIRTFCAELREIPVEAHDAFQMRSAGQLPVKPKLKEAAQQTL